MTPADGCFRSFVVSGGNSGRTKEWKKKKPIKTIYLVSMCLFGADLKPQQLFRVLVWIRPPWSSQESLVLFILTIFLRRVGKCRDLSKLSPDTVLLVRWRVALGAFMAIISTHDRRASLI